MKPAFTLIETLIALVISGVLFMAIFSLTSLSIKTGHDNIKLQIALSRELSAISDYDQARLEGKSPKKPSFLIETKQQSWGVTGESNLGYQGVLLP